MRSSAGTPVQRSCRTAFASRTLAIGVRSTDRQRLSRTDRGYQARTRACTGAVKVLSRQVGNAACIGSGLPQTREPQAFVIVVVRALGKLGDFAPVDDLQIGEVSPIKTAVARDESAAAALCVQHRARSRRSGAFATRLDVGTLASGPRRDRRTFDRMDQKRCAPRRRTAA